MVVLSLLPVEVHIKVVRGTDNTIEFTLTNEAGVPVNLAPETVKFTARKQPGGAVTIATKTNGPGAHSTPASGKTQFKLTKTDLADAAGAGNVTTWYYEVRRVLTNADEVTYIAGNLVITPTATPS